MIYLSQEVLSQPDAIAMSSTPQNLGNSPITVADNQVVSDATLHILLAAMRVMSRSVGILHIETAYHRWQVLLKGGGLVLIEEEGQIISTLVRKYAGKGLQFSRIPDWEKKQANRPFCFPFVTQVYRRYPDHTKQVLREIILESLLALHLEDKFSFVWQPINDLAIDLPSLQLALLEGNASGEAKQWQQFQCVKHPYQQVQLLDAANLLARVGNDNFPLFAKVTTGQHRISEIADSFKQPLFRTALLLDKLAQKKIVSILPLADRQSAEKLGESGGINLPSAPNAGSLEPKIFVVDDSPVLLRQFRQLLSGWGYQVSLTDNSEQATDLIVAYEPNVVFIDINMPGLSGFELIKQIRRQPQLASLPLVLVTAENSMTNSFRARWASCRFIAKPRTSDETEKFRDELRAMLREVAPLSTDSLV
ncbi:response regulator [Tumidithrix elongata RA019]|uniref:Response regulator n=1 Tax=Tumidithrix elongata BACA0141 TaxID=2716417 RepID=A0AAW9PU83_9CYAN|nr:response regulator [Tumidithrix elongata RA019]